MSTPARIAGKYGKRPPKRARALKLGPLLTGTVPDHPASEDYLAALGGGWEMLGNDVAGDCVAVTWANVRRLVTTTLTASPNYPSQDEVWAVYRTQNPDFDPNGSPDTDGPGSASGTQLHGAHVWGNSQWCYLLDTETQLDGCISDVPSTGNTGMILIRSGGGARVVGGYHYAGAGSAGCGIQLGDTVNQCQQAFIDTGIIGLTGSGLPTASIALVNDGGQNMVRASVNQASGPAMYGNANAASLYELFLTGQSTPITAVQESVGMPQFHPWMPSDNRLLLAAGDPASFLQDSGALTSGLLFLVKLVARQTVQISNLWVNNAEAASGASTGSFAGLYSSSGTLLTGSSDIASLFTGFTPLEIPLTTPTTVYAGTFVWAALLFNLSSSNPGLYQGQGSNPGGASAGLTAAAGRFVTNGTGRTTLPSSITPSSNSFTTKTLWVGAS